MLRRSFTESRSQCTKEEFKHILALVIHLEIVGHNAPKRNLNLIVP